MVFIPMCYLLISVLSGILCWLRNGDEADREGKRGSHAGTGGVKIGK